MCWGGGAWLDWAGVPHLSFVSVFKAAAAQPSSHEALIVKSMTNIKNIGNCRSNTCR